MTAAPLNSLDLKAFRKKIRLLRRQLRPDQQHKAASQLCKTLGSSPIFLRSRHIAFYLPNDGEIDSTLLMERAWKLKKTCYLPVLAPLDKKLLFVSYNKGDELRFNQYGIPEPLLQPDKTRAAWTLDLVITPLVAFDLQGHRLGMGGGYYDRTFAFIQKANKPKTPKFVGVAHAFQQCPALPRQIWDVSLDAVFTDNAQFIWTKKQELSGP